MTEDPADDDGRKGLDAAVRAEMLEAHRDLYAWLSRRVGPDDARDILHDIFVKILSRYESLRDEDRLRPWMAQIMRTTLIDYLRSGRVRSEGLERLRAAFDAEDPELVLRRIDPYDSIDAAVCLCLYRLLPTMPAAHADLIWRLDLLGQSRAEVAAEQGVSDATLRVRLHRARRALRDRLEETCLTCPEHGYLDCGCDDMKALRERLRSQSS